MKERRNLMQIPNATPAKESPPEEILKAPNIPTKTKFSKTTPEESSVKNKTPEESTKIETVPDPSPEKEEKPSDFIEENCIIIDGQKVEIKPTKLKYFRNKAASAYGVIRAVPLHELLTYGRGVLDERRDADQLLYDFLVASFNDSAFVRDHYDELDADQVDKIVKIFGRINHIDEKEEQARKNKEAQAQAKH